MKRHLEFKTTVSKQKPDTVRNKKAKCPFCDISTIKKENGVLAEEGSMLLVKNKFLTLKNCYQTVFIESDTCQDDLSTYKEEKLYDVLSFGLKQWLIMSQTNSFKSVLFFKNHGILSGSSISHPHMQLVGLEDKNYREEVKDEDFEGYPILRKKGLEWNVSTKPRSEFYEFNLKINKKDIMALFENHMSQNYKQFCRCIQHCIHYILHVLCPVSKSFNLSFYEWNNEIIVKVFPRGFGNGTANSIYYLGYNLSQVPSNLTDIANEICEMYVL